MVMARLGQRFVSWESWPSGLALRTEGQWWHVPELSVPRTSLLLLYQQMSMEVEAGKVQSSGAFDLALVVAVQHFASMPRQIVVVVVAAAVAAGIAVDNFEDGHTRERMQTWRSVEEEPGTEYSEHVDGRKRLGVDVDIVAGIGIGC